MTCTALLMVTLWHLAGCNSSDDFVFIYRWVWGGAVQPILWFWLSHTTYRLVTIMEMTRPLPLSGNTLFLVLSAVLYIQVSIYIFRQKQRSDNWVALWLSSDASGATHQMLSCQTPACYNFLFIFTDSDAISYGFLLQT